jgi:hypothetical protein
MILIAYHSPVLRAIAFITVANVPAAELVRHVVCVDTRDFHWGEVSVYEAVVLGWILMLHRRTERDLVSILQDGRLSSDNAYPVGLCERA